MKTKIILHSATLFLTLSCALPGLKPRAVEEYYVSTGVEKYFLSDIPDWANFSQDSKCFRTKGLRYFDINALMKSYSLNYFEALQLQGLFNEEFVSSKKFQGKNILSLKEEENIFFKASEKVGSKIFFTDLPNFRRIHLIWVDEALRDKSKTAKLKNFLSSPVHNEGVPVLISACLTRKEVEDIFPEINYKSITAELYSIYNQEGKREPNLHVDLSVFFKPDQKLFFYGQDPKNQIDDIQGNYKILNY